MRPYQIILALSLLASPALSDPSQIVPQTVPYQPHIADIPETENAIVCVAGDTLHLSGTFNNAGYATAFFEAAHKIVDTKDILVPPGSAYAYSFSYTPSFVGMTNLKIGGFDRDGRPTFIRTLHLDVLQSAPLLLGKIPDTACNDLSEAVYQQGGDFHTTRVAFVFDGKPAPGAGSFGCSLPVSSSATGIYTFGYSAWDDRGRFFAGPCGMVSVPDRATVTSNGVYAFQATGDKMPLSVKIADGVAVKEVSYSIDGKQVADCTNPPFSGYCDMSMFASGSLQVVARVVTQSGQVFDSPALPLRFTNAPRDAEDAQTAKQDADRQAAIQIAQANAIAAEEAAKDNGPTGPARKALRNYLLSHATNGDVMLDVKDVRKSDSTIYPSDIYAIIQDSQGRLYKFVYSANLESGQFSDIVKTW